MFLRDVFETQGENVRRGVVGRAIAQNGSTSCTIVQEGHSAVGIVHQISSLILDGSNEIRRETVSILRPTEPVSGLEISQCPN